MIGVHGRRAPSGLTPEALHLVHQEVNGVVPLTECVFQLLAPLLKRLDFLALAFTGRLGGATVSQYTLDAALLLLVFRLGTFPVIRVRILVLAMQKKVAGAYLGGRFVLGSGRTWPQDFRFFVGFLSPAVSGAGVSSLSMVEAGVRTQSSGSVMVESSMIVESSNRDG